MPCALCLELQNRARHLLDAQRSNPLGGLVQQHQTALAQIVAIKLQSQWSACIEDRAVSGHWEAICYSAMPTARLRRQKAPQSHILAGGRNVTCTYRGAPGKPR